MTESRRPRPPEPTDEDPDEMVFEIDMTGGRDSMVITGPAGRAETQASLFEALEVRRPDDLLFGRSTLDRYLYVAYEVEGSWVGVLLDPQWATHGDGLADLEDEFMSFLVRTRGVDVETAWFFKTIVEREYGESVLVQAVADLA